MLGGLDVGGALGSVGHKGIDAGLPPCREAENDQKRQLLAYSHLVSWPKVGNRLALN